MAFADWTTTRRRVPGEDWWADEGASVEPMPGGVVPPVRIPAAVPVALGGVPGGGERDFSGDWRPGDVRPRSAFALTPRLGGVPGVNGERPERGFDNAPPDFPGGPGIRPSAPGLDPRDLQSPHDLAELDTAPVKRGVWDTIGRALMGASMGWNGDFGGAIALGREPEERRRRDVAEREAQIRQDRADREELGDADLRRRYRQAQIDELDRRHTQPPTREFQIVNGQVVYADDPTHPVAVPGLEPQARPLQPRWEIQQTTGGLVRVNPDTGEAEAVQVNGQPVYPYTKPDAGGSAPTAAQIKQAEAQWIESPEGQAALTSAGMDALDAEARAIGLKGAHEWPQAMAAAQAAGDDAAIKRLASAQQRAQAAAQARVQQMATARGMGGASGGVNDANQAIAQINAMAANGQLSRAEADKRIAEVRRREAAGGRR